MDNVINLEAYREALAFKRWRLGVTGRVAVTTAEVTAMADRLADIERWKRENGGFRWRRVGLPV